MRKGIKWIIALVGAAIFVLLLRCFAFTSYYIPSKGMESSLLCGDRILVNKWSYGLRAPLLSQFPYQRWKEQLVERGDIVVFNNPANPSTVIDKKEVFITRCTCRSSRSSLSAPPAPTDSTPSGKTGFVSCRFADSPAETSCPSAGGPVWSIAGRG